MHAHPVVSRDEWLHARTALLAREKQLTRLRDEINSERLALPWVKVDKAYTFHTCHGSATLPELFGSRSQLVVYHFMFGPDWEAGCPGCSFLVDHIDGALPHLRNHDVTFTVVSRAPLARIEAYKKRMGWKFPWVSSFGSEFNYDYGVTLRKEDVAAGRAVFNYRAIPASEKSTDIESPGLSSFYKDEQGTVFHTYSSFARGGEELIGTLMIFDRAPLGRNEKSTMDFLRRHDEYDDAREANTCCSGTRARL